MVNNKKITIASISTFAVLVVLGIVWLTMVFTVPAGTTGVAFDPFGKYTFQNPTTGQSEETAVRLVEYTEGIHVKAPWVKIDYFNIRTQDYTMTSAVDEDGKAVGDSSRVVTSEGLYVDLDLTVLYKIDPTRVDEIRRDIGEDGQYQTIVVRPTIRSTIRDIVSKYEAVDVYGDSRETVQAEMHQALELALGERGIIVEQFLLRKVGLPQMLVQAIEQKKQAEQEALRMEYVIEKESLEKERKIIEAEGIAQANDIIQLSLSDEYLTWYWIENLDEHESVVYIIDGESGLPLFKDIDKPITP